MQLSICDAKLMAIQVPNTIKRPPKSLTIFNKWKGTNFDFLWRWLHAHCECSCMISSLFHFSNRVFLMAVVLCSYSSRCYEWWILQPLQPSYSIKWQHHRRHVTLKNPCTSFICSTPTFTVRSIDVIIIVLNFLHFNRCWTDFNECTSIKPFSAVHKSLGSSLDHVMFSLWIHEFCT